ARSRAAIVPMAVLFATGSSTRHRSGNRASGRCCASKSSRAIPAFRSETAPGRGLRPADLPGRDRDFVQTNGLALVVLDLESLLLLVEADLRGLDGLSLALALCGEPDLGERKLVVHGAVGAAHLPEAHGPVAGEDDLASAVGQRDLSGEVDVP